MPSGLVLTWPGLSCLACEAEMVTVPTSGLRRGWGAHAVRLGCSPVPRALEAALPGRCWAGPLLGGAPALPETGMELVQPHVCSGHGGRAHQEFRASHNCRFGRDSWGAGSTVDCGHWWVEGWAGRPR